LGIKLLTHENVLFYRISLIRRLVGAMKQDVNSRIHIPCPHVLEIIRVGLRQSSISSTLSTLKEILAMYGSNSKK
jgi:hypothetical protein